MRLRKIVVSPPTNLDGLALSTTFAGQSLSSALQHMLWWVFAPRSSIQQQYSNNSSSLATIPFRVLFAVKMTARSEARRFAIQARKEDLDVLSQDREILSSTSPARMAHTKHGAVATLADARFNAVASAALSAFTDLLQRMCARSGIHEKRCTAFVNWPSRENDSRAKVLSSRERVTRESEEETRERDMHRRKEGEG